MLASSQTCLTLVVNRTYVFINASILYVFDTLWRPQVDVGLNVDCIFFEMLNCVSYAVYEKAISRKTAVIHLNQRQGYVLL